ncbi:Gp49 family protein [Sphingomonas sp. AR_OL41]|uniref:Gp49 family protein n=1 Tax=Sphingomonas sp. AR_OL41 TaxID=3042729 RepID=UPI00247FD41E|nr:Gp49 family protein [Sphingomonas sp. AR_OL41]MDH7973724.1 Gp49 family protein [Sphingomonas sp. AR_OL41]
MLKVEHRGASIDVLRAVADRIDCEPGCERVGRMDPSTGVTECPMLDRGECPFDDACQLRDLAAALETHAATTWRPNPSPTAERTNTMETLPQTEARCAAGATAPRVTLADLEANIAAEYSFIASDALAGIRPNVPGHPALDVLTICLIVTRNGFTIIGKAAPASPENFDIAKGKANAREDALRQLWPLMGYALRERQASPPRGVTEPLNYAVD